MESTPGFNTGIFAAMIDGCDVTYQSSQHSSLSAKKLPMANFIGKRWYHWYESGKLFYEQKPMAEL